MLIKVHGTHASRSNSSGYSLIELLIAMGLLLIAGAMSSKALTSSLQIENKSAAESTASSQTRAALAIMERDFRAAGSDTRRSTSLADTTHLTQALRAQDPATQIDAQDIVYASANEIHFRADVTPVPGVECVVYFMTADGRLIRQVRLYNPNAQCGQAGNDAIRLNYGNIPASRRISQTILLSRTG